MRFPLVRRSEQPNQVTAPAQEEPEGENQAPQNEMVLHNGQDNQPNEIVLHAPENQIATIPIPEQAPAEGGNGELVPLAPNEQIILIPEQERIERAIGLTETLTAGIMNAERSRAEQRYGTGAFGSVKEYIATTKTGRVLKTTAQIGAGVALTVGAGTLAGTGGILFAPTLFSQGVKNIAQGVTEMIQVMGGDGKRISDLRDKKCDHLSKYTDQLAEVRRNAELPRDAEGKMSIEELEDRIASITENIKIDEAKMEVAENEDIATENKARRRRTVVGTTASVAVGLLHGVPLGWQDFDKDGVEHAVRLGWHGFDFMYNSANELANSGNAIHGLINHIPSAANIITDHAHGLLGDNIMSSLTDAAHTVGAVGSEMYRGVGIALGTMAATAGVEYNRLAKNVRAPFDGSAKVERTTDIITRMQELRVPFRRTPIQEPVLTNPEPVPQREVLVGEVIDPPIQEPTRVRPIEDEIIEGEIIEPAPVAPELPPVSRPALEAPPIVVPALETSGITEETPPPADDVVVERPPVTLEQEGPPTVDEMIANGDYAGIVDRLSRSEELSNNGQISDRDQITQRIFAPDAAGRELKQHVLAEALNEQSLATHGLANTLAVKYLVRKAWANRANTPDEPFLRDPYFGEQGKHLAVDDQGQLISFDFSEATEGRHPLGMHDIQDYYIISGKNKGQTGRGPLQGSAMVPRFGDAA